MNISVPDELAERVRARDLPISSICQDALRKAVELDEKKERTMPDLEAVVERLRGTQYGEKQRAIEEGHQLGILWAKQWATAEELREVAEADLIGFQQFMMRRDTSTEEFYKEVDHTASREYGHEQLDGFKAGAEEVWETVKDLL
ncbi:type II toxin-antitoxin system CcdA family antitoxin [Streptomyces liliifuscus]|uniref:Uncharacterized protein n=1 Tax=Streptomyces liliifuscus TaxID=2797636 RepID=A0A7T7I880_9ACTN|nr:type II toxin-antitoxin system CcdA family antitoxin [Streptomyces liliifuscus]QQM42811.1 hypothetical protein JEQ17_27575 [Streptomyces liliifuscus]